MERIWYSQKKLMSTTTLTLTLGPTRCQIRDSVSLHLCSGVGTDLEQQASAPPSSGPRLELGDPQQSHPPTATWQSKLNQSSGPPQRRPKRFNKRSEEQKQNKKTNNTESSRLASRFLKGGKDCGRVGIQQVCFLTFYRSISLLMGQTEAFQLCDVHFLNVSVLCLDGIRVNPCVRPFDSTPCVLSSCFITIEFLEETVIRHCLVSQQVCFVD